MKRPHWIAKNEYIKNPENRDFPGFYVK